jgi:hypothetical protein
MLKKYCSNVGHHSYVWEGVLIRLWEYSRLRALRVGTKIRPYMILTRLPSRHALSMAWLGHNDNKYFINSSVRACMLRNWLGANNPNQYYIY